MTTDKPKWWQSWVVYAIVGLLMTVGTYVGGYFWLGKHTVAARDHIRQFNYGGLRKVFSLLGWAEAKIRGEFVFLAGPDGNADTYEPNR